MTALRCRYSRARGVLAATAQDALLLLVIAAVLARRLRTPPGGARWATLLAVGAGLVLLWNVLTLHFPRSVELDDEGVSFGGYGRAHRFRWRDVERLRVRRFLVRDRVLVRLSPAPPWRGRYWLLDGLERFDELVRALEKRASAVGREP